MAASWSVVALLLASSLVVCQSCFHMGEVVEANGVFAVDLYQTIGANPAVTNMIFSPWSVSTALAMTHHGAIDETREEMEDVLGFSGMGPPCLAQSGFHSLIALLNGVSTINTANRIFVDDDSLIFTAPTPFQSGFLNLVYTSYLAPVTDIDISGNPGAATNAINSWVSGETNGQIPNLLQSPLDSGTKVVLVNAITFKGNWSQPFTMKTNGDFHLSDTETTQTCKMSMSCGPKWFKHGVVAGTGSQIVELPYVLHAMSMYIIRPDTIEGLANLELNLDLATINNAIAAMTWEQVNVILPKFSLSQNVDLIDYL